MLSGDCCKVIKASCPEVRLKILGRAEEHETGVPLPFELLRLDAAGLSLFPSSMLSSILSSSMKIMSLGISLN